MAALCRNLTSMPAQLIDGKALAAKVREEVAAEVEELGDVGLTTVLVGDDAASDVYIRGKHKAAIGVGIQANEAIDPGKDVDGFHPINAGLLYLGRPNLVPGTPLGIMRMLAEYGIETKGARAVVVGRSNIVGKPVAHLLLQAHATVTICHSRTVDLERHTLDADILVAAVGHLHVIGADMVKAGSTVIDVGMNRTEEGLFGDVDPSASERAAYMTPVPGGVGPMTIAMLLKNTVTAARARRGLVSGVT